MTYLLLDNEMQVDRQDRRQRGAPKGDSGSGAGALSRGLQVVDVLSQAGGYLSLSEIAAETDLDPSTAHRLLQVLIDAGYAVRDDAQKRYLPGPRALSPLSLFHPLTQLRGEVQPVLHQVRAELGETCALVLFIGDERLVVDFVQGDHPLSPYYDTWLKSPLHGSASGKLLLAWMGQTERERLLGPGPYKACTPKTITDPGLFADCLEAVRRNGYAVAREDAYASLVAIGVPLAFRPRSQVVGCLVVTSSSSSLPESSEEKVADKLRAMARLLMNSAPSMQMFRQWTVRPSRSPVAPGLSSEPN